jgi:aquaporin Z
MPAMKAREALARHWPEYLIEAWGLGTFMVSAGVIATLLGSPRSPAQSALLTPFVRGMLAGIAMGLTSIALVYSPWGRRSGAHWNPALTLTFLRLGRMQRWDAIFFAAAQTVGGLLGVCVVAALLGTAFTEPPVRYAATLPGMGGPLPAFAAEFVISGVLMFVILVFSGIPRLAPSTGIAAGCLVAFYITFEAPLSGMSMNPARTLASAAPGGHWDSLWVYLSAPLLGMLAGAQIYLKLPWGRRAGCAKLMHSTAVRCIHCSYEPSPGSPGDC